MSGKLSPVKNPNRTKKQEIEPTKLVAQSGLKRVDDWFQQKGWTAFPFQRTSWKSYRSGQDFLLHSTTGSGKTLAAWLGPVTQFIDEPTEGPGWTRKRGKPPAPPLTVLWITPLRSLSADTEASLWQPIEELNLPWTIQRRTGDSSASMKAAQRKQLPTALITTPESLLLLLSYPEAKENFRHLKMIVVDEWHELLGTKRGVQTELAMSWLSSIAPDAVRCGLSATLGNTHQALDVLCGTGRTRPRSCIEGRSDKSVLVETVLPQTIERFPWAGHLGLSMVAPVVQAIDRAQSSLVFTNTRNQTEQWYRHLLHARPDWSGILALHHGSLDASVRKWVEESLRAGKLKAVVCTSSLDLGVDFSAVDQVIQVGSPKGAARLLQRAGRSGHSPGATSRLLFVPTHAFELVELAAAKEIVAKQMQKQMQRQKTAKKSKDNERGSEASKPRDPSDSLLETRQPLNAPIDCLTQHAVTRALPEPYTREQLREELLRTFTYRSLTEEELDWALRFVVHGGDSLRAYPDFHRVTISEGLYHVTDPKVARLHRMAMGTIAGDLVMQVKYASGRTLGTVEESYIAKIKPGDCFQFAGKTLELIMTREGAAIVRKSKKQPNTTPRWNGGRMPLSSQLAEQVRNCLDAVAKGKLSGHGTQGPELQRLEPIFDLQSRWSIIPEHGVLLVESFQMRNQYYTCFYPFEGRLVHEGFGALAAWRYAQRYSVTLSISVNDYGFMLQSTQPLQLDEVHVRSLFDSQSLVDHLNESLNLTELAKRQFREIARISGLVHPGIPGQPKQGRHLQSSTSMFYDAFQQYDPKNKLLAQAKQELLTHQFEIDRMNLALERLVASRVELRPLKRPSPLAFPLLVEQLRQRLSSESLESRVRRLQSQLESEADR